MTRILIADDHALVREGLRQILAEGLADTQFGETATAQETLARAQSESWDVLVLDIFMPGRSGFEVLQQIRQSRPRLAVLVLSSAPEEQLAVRVYQAGAAGYLNKHAAPEELVEAVRRVLASGRYVGVKSAETLALEIARACPQPHERLSNRELEVLRLLVVGYSLKEIAWKLSLSAKTISTFHTRIREKLGVPSDVKLIHYALEHRLFECAAPAGTAARQINSEPSPSAVGRRLQTNQPFFCSGNSPSGST